MPTKSELMDAIMEAVRLLNGCAKTSEIDSCVAEALNLSDELLTLEDDTSTGTVYNYKMRWARTALKQNGLLSNPSRGIWTITEEKKYE